MARSTTPKTETATAALNGGWQPAFTLDILKASPAAFRALVEAFAERAQREPRPNLHLRDGWHDFTPQVCEQVLMLNAGNRQVSFAAVQYYARQMLAGEWFETGQPVIFDKDGGLVDAQHRQWAGYLSGATFTSYVVNQRKEIPNGFAYIDNSKARSIQDALYTAGLNGLSNVLSQAVKLAWQHESGALTPLGVNAVDKLTPRDAIAYVQSHPVLRQAMRQMAGDHAGAAAVIGYRDVAGYMAYLILTHHDEFVLDEFMEQMAEESDEPEPGSAIAAFQAEMEKDKTAKKPMRRHHVLGYLIKTFNAWVQQEPVRKLSLKVNEDFPDIVTKDQVQQEAAE